MKRLIVSSIAAAALATMAIPALAEGIKIGFVDGQRVLKESPQAAKVKKKLEKEFEPRDQELQKMAKQLEDLQTNLQKNAPTMADSQRHAKEQELGDLNRTFQRRQREFREDLSQRQNEELVAFNERVYKLIRQIAEQEKIDLIVQEAVYFSPRIDLTDKVIKAMGDNAK